MEQLPIDVLLCIAVHLLPASVLSLSVVSRRFRFLVKAILDREFPATYLRTSPPEPHLAWRRLSIVNQRREAKIQPRERVWSMAMPISDIHLLPTPSKCVTIVDNLQVAMLDLSSAAPKTDWKMSVALPQVSAMCYTDGDLWVATKTGVQRIDLEHHEAVTHIAGAPQSRNDPTMAVAPILATTKRSIKRTVGSQTLICSTLSSVFEIDTRAPHGRGIGFRSLYPLSAAADTEYIYVAQGKSLAIYDRRNDTTPLTSLLHRNTVRSVSVTEGAPDAIFTSTHGDSLMSSTRDTSVRVWNRGTWTLRGGEVDLQSGVSRLASCGRHAIAVSEKQTVVIVSDQGTELARMKGMRGCDIDYTRAAYLRQTNIALELVILQW